MVRLEERAGLTLRSCFGITPSVSEGPRASGLLLIRLGAPFAQEEEVFLLEPYRGPKYRIRLPEIRWGRRGSGRLGPGVSLRPRLRSLFGGACTALTPSGTPSGAPWVCTLGVRRPGAVPPGGARPWRPVEAEGA